MVQRLKIRSAARAANGVVIKFPESFEMLLAEGPKVGLDAPATRAFLDSGDEIFDIDLINSEDVIYLSTGGEFNDPRIEAERLIAHEREERMKAEEREAHEREERMKAEEERMKAKEGEAHEREERMKAEEERKEGLVRESFLASLVSSSMPPVDRARRVLGSEPAQYAVSSFQALVRGVVGDGQGKQPPWPSTFAVEDDVHDALERVLRDAPGRRMRVFNHSYRALSLSRKRPDVVLCGEDICAACDVGNSCSWAMVCFTIELKKTAFSQTQGAHVADMMTADGLGAFAQLLDRCKHYGHDEVFYGAVVDSTGVMFWRADPVAPAMKNRRRKWTRWPETGPCSLTERDQFGVTGLQYLQAMCAASVMTLRPSTADREMLHLLKDVRERLQTAGQATRVLPVNVLGGNRPVVLGVFTQEHTPESVVKLWCNAADGVEERVSNEARGLQLHLPGTGELKMPSDTPVVWRLHRGQWSGLHLKYHGPTTMGEMMQYMHVHARGGMNAWAAVRGVVDRVASTLLALHRSRLVHCDVKPANVVLGAIAGGQFGAATLVDFEHTVIVGEEVPGYTTRYCARSVRGKPILHARRFMDWEALFFSLVDVILHEHGFAYLDDVLENPRDYWRKEMDRIESATSVNLDDPLALSPHLKDPFWDARVDVEAYLTAFAEAIMAVGNKVRVLTRLEDRQFEKTMLQFFEGGSEGSEGSVDDDEDESDDE